MSTEVPGWKLRLGDALGATLCHGVWRTKVIGAERVPQGEPVVFVANHTGFLDGPAVWTTSPRRTAFLVKKQMFDAWFGWILRGVGQIPIDRDRGDRRAMSTALDVLRGRGAVGVFPEGTRGEGDVAEVQQGAAWLSLQSGARVVPVACLGTRGKRGKNSLPRVRSLLVVDFGDPFALEPSPGVAGRERLRLATEELRTNLAAHVARARAEAPIV